MRGKRTTGEELRQLKRREGESKRNERAESRNPTGLLFEHRILFTLRKDKKKTLRHPVRICKLSADGNRRSR